MAEVITGATATRVGIDGKWRTPVVVSRRA
jgi:hypothetical protein